MRDEVVITRALINEKIAGYHRRTIENPALMNSAVLVPIIQRGENLELLFTKRTDTVEHHKGQISFPGGASDPEDASEIETALRESFEEIGLDRSLVAILGMLDDLETPSGFKITPVVGFIQTMPQLIVNKDEVAEIISIPLDQFFDAGKRRSKMMDRNGTTVEVFFYDVWNEPVWGATAFFVKQLVDVLQRS